MDNMYHADIERHVVLISPGIHWNTGNIGRSCIGAGAFLHLIKPLGFSLDQKEVKRAGLDYWHKVKLVVWDDFDAFKKAMAVLDEEVALITKNGVHSIWELPFCRRMFLIFGSETNGLPQNILKMYGKDLTYHIPISRRIRSLNLSTAAGIALYESLRFAPEFHAWP
jgi:tRNA (cytidine/uridine-2'-O-)-methyltransferase